MCLIIAPGKDNKPALLPEDVFKFVFNRNNDGFGAMWTQDGRVEHVKILNLSQKEEYDYMKKLVEEHPDVVFHMRYKTHGKIIPSLCHPFRILHRNRHGKDMFFMHNGVLSKYGNNLSYGQSDTTSFKDKILVPLLTRNPDALDDPAIWKMLNEITVGSRLFFMDSTGKTWKTHETSWNNRYGLTLSNSYMLPVQSSSASNYNSPFDYDDDDTSNVIGFPTRESVRRSSSPKADMAYSVFRNRLLPDGSVVGGWYKEIVPGLIRAEKGGSLFYDRGTDVPLRDKDYITSHSETLIITQFQEKNKKAKEELNDPLPDDVPLSSEVTTPAPIDERLRYARLVHNCHSGRVACRTQLIADLLGMGNKELAGFVREDPVNTEVVLSELLEIVFDMNDVLSHDPTCEELCFNIDELCELGEVSNHQSSMKNIGDKRREHYKMLAEHAAAQEEETRKQKSA